MYILTDIRNEFTQIPTVVKVELDWHSIEVGVLLASDRQCYDYVIHWSTKIYCCVVDLDAIVIALGYLVAGLTSTNPAYYAYYRGACVVTT